MPHVEDYLEDLQENIKLLEQAYKETFARLDKEFPDHSPLGIKDGSGRYILLDSLTELVKARSVITQYYLKTNR